MNAPQRLFDPLRHEPLAGAAWSERAAREAITRIADAAFAEFEGERGWVCHPQDEPATPDERYHGLYLGAAGVIWALEHLAAQGAVERRIDFAPFVKGIVDRNRLALDAPQHGMASYMLGDSGTQWLQWRFEPSAAHAQALYDTVQGNLHNPVREALWGSPGSVLAAIHVAEATGESHWKSLVHEAMAIILDEMQPDDDIGGAWLWEQDLYGRRRRMLGAGHGFAGNVYPALRAAAMLPPDLVQTFTDRALRTLQATARRDGDRINWPTRVDTPELMAGPLTLVQDCHGAPGIVCRLAGAPRTAAWDDLLLGGGELTWQAGPLTKGPSLCHGTAGSAMACLKLWRRSGDGLWMDRARALAMHAARQVEQARARHGIGRQALWTGDLGVACTLWNCITDQDIYPTLDA